MFSRIRSKPSFIFALVSVTAFVKGLALLHFSRSTTKKNARLINKASSFEKKNLEKKVKMTMKTRTVGGHRILDSYGYNNFLITGVARGMSRNIYSLCLGTCFPGRERE